MPKMKTRMAANEQNFCEGKRHADACAALNWNTDVLPQSLEKAWESWVSRDCWLICTRMVTAMNWQHRMEYAVPALSQLPSHA